MHWNKQHSKNAVAAKNRIRLERANAPIPDEPPYSAPKLGKFVPDFTINIRSKSGERLQITATRFGRQFITGEGIKSARSISRAIEILLRKCTL